MTSKHRIRQKYRIELREHDHGAAHVHLTGGGIDVLIWLETLEAEGACPLNVKTDALAWIAAHRDELMEDWKKWHA
ncbi:MAG: DUF4160 domain-containing protein [Zoogloeaceae bacterium]|jgi:hypothetical protein|nr:DUF4160 domain-containing protein [Zoogloeaceae bacterium]